jgi:hypothetical protein
VSQHPDCRLLFVVLVPPVQPCCREVSGGRALCEVDSAWTAAARDYGEVLMLHGPHLGLRVPSWRADAAQERRTELASARKDGLVTGGLMQWGRVGAL